MPSPLPSGQSGSQTTLNPHRIHPSRRPFIHDGAPITPLQRKNRLLHTLASGNDKTRSIRERVLGRLQPATIPPRSCSSAPSNCPPSDGRARRPTGATRYSPQMGRFRRPIRDLFARDRVIDAVQRAKMSRRAAGRHYEVSESVAIKWLERLERHGSREPVGDGGHRTSKLTQHRDFLRAAQAEKSDITAKRPQPFAWRGPRRSAAG